MISPNRTAWLLLVAKTIVAIALLAALTLPFTTCTTSGKVEEQRIAWSFDQLQTIACFVWPIPVLLARALSRRLRVSITMVLIECALAIAAWFQIAMQVMMAVLISFGAMQPASGADLAESSLMGYLALSVLEATLLALGSTRAARARTPACRTPPSPRPCRGEGVAGGDTCG